MSGVIVNTITVIIGSITGLLFKKGMPKKITDAIMIGIGLCTVSIGISGLVSDVNTIILIISIVLGAIVGTALDIDAKINHMGDFLSKKFKSNDDKASVSEGFVTACLLFCIGSMTIVGSLNAGISGDNKLLYTKALLDLVSSTVLATSLGIGVLFASAFVFVFQGALVMLSQQLAPFLTPETITQLNGAGSLLILALGLNIVGITKIKIANYLPAIVFAPILTYIYSFVMTYISTLM